MATNWDCTAANLQTTLNAATSGSDGDVNTISVTDGGTLSAALQWPATLDYLRIQPKAGAGAYTIEATTNCIELLHSGSDDPDHIEIRGAVLKHSPSGANSPLVKVNGVAASLTLTSCHLWAAGVAGNVFAPSTAGLHTGTMALDSCTFQGNFNYLAYGAAGMADVRVTDCDCRPMSGMSYVLYGNAWGYEFTRSRFAAAGLHEGLNAFSPAISKSVLHACEFRRTTGSNVFANFVSFSGTTIDWIKTLFIGNQGAGAAGNGVTLASGVGASTFVADACGFVGWGNPAVTATNAQTLTRCGFYQNTADVGGSATKGTGCVTTDPMFTDPSAHDFTIPDTSPWFDTAGDTGLSTDLSGYSLPQGAADDIGPSELEVAAVAPDPTINLLSAIPDGPLSLVLTFDRPPAGDVLDPDAYTVTPNGDYAAIAVASVALGDPAPGEVYPTTVILTFAAQGTGGESYTVTVAGITGPSDEALGAATADFTAEATALELLDAGVSGSTILVRFSLPLDEETLGDPGDWTLSGDVELPTIAGVSIAGGGYAVSLAITGEVLDGTTVECPADVADLAANVVDPAHRTAEVAGAVEPPSFDGDDDNSPTLWVGPNGEPLERSWSVLPDDPDDADEVLDRLLVAYLGTDRAATDRDAIPVSPAGITYRGGCWADAYAPETLDSRGWMTQGAPLTEDTADRVAQLRREDLQRWVDEGYLSAVRVSVTAAADGLDVEQVLTLPDGRVLSGAQGA